MREISIPSHSSTPLWLTHQHPLPLSHARTRHKFSTNSQNISCNQGNTGEQTNIHQPTETSNLSCDTCHVHRDKSTHLYSSDDWHLVLSFCICLLFPYLQSKNDECWIASKKKKKKKQQQQADFITQPPCWIWTNRPVEEC